MPGTDLAYGGMLPHAMSGTEIAYGATRTFKRAGKRLVVSAYTPATRCPVLTWRMLLCGVRYWPSVCCYAMSGTDLASTATRILRLRKPLTSSGRTVRHYLKSAYLQQHLVAIDLI
eukprot:181762-Rhodomonas_salina.2